MPSAACPPTLDVIGDLLADACRVEELLLNETVNSRLSALICNFPTNCCGIDLDQMSARYLSVYFHNVVGESEGVFMRRSKTFIREDASVTLSGTGNLVLS